MREIPNKLLEEVDNHSLWNNSYLKKMQTRIYVEPHQSTPFHFIIKIPPEMEENKKQRIKALAMKYKIAATTFSLSTLP